MNILISRCLLGFPCRYDGKSTDNERLDLFMAKYKEKHNFIGVCPEVEGGLPIPRAKSERIGDKVMSEYGEDNTEAFEAGANIAVKKAIKYNAQVAILKSKSPSCGTGIIYDGTFTSKLIPGNGVTSQKLSDIGVYVITEEDLDKIEYLLDNED